MLPFPIHSGGSGSKSVFTFSFESYSTGAGWCVALFYFPLQLMNFSPIELLRELFAFCKNFSALQ